MAGHALQGVEVLELAIFGHCEHGPQVAGAGGRHVVGADQGLADVDEDLGAAIGQVAGVRVGAVGEVVHGVDITLADVLAVDGDGLRTKAIGVVDIQLGIGAAHLHEVDVVVRVDDVRVQVGRLGAPVQHHAHAVQVIHHRADGVGRAVARAFDHQVGVARLFDDHQG